MNIFELFFGLFMLLMGFLYLYCPDKISKINEWVKENIFNDRILLTHRRKVGVLLILLGIVLVFFAIK